MASVTLCADDVDMEISTASCTLPFPSSTCVYNVYTHAYITIFYNDMSSYHTIYTLFWGCKRTFSFTILVMFPWTTDQYFKTQCNTWQGGFLVFALSWFLVCHHTLYLSEGEHNAMNTNQGMF